MFMLPSMANANRGPGCACQVITMAEPNPSFLETIVIGNGAPQIQPALASFIGALSPEDLQVFVTALSYSQFWGNDVAGFLGNFERRWIEIVFSFQAVFRDPRYLGGWQIAGIVNEKIAGQFGNVRRVRFDASGQNIQISTLKNFSIALLSSGGVDRNSGQFIGRPPQRAGKSGQDNGEGRSDKTFILVSNVRDPSDTDETGSVEGGAVFFGFLGLCTSVKRGIIAWI
jgi:hypothetical protein